MMYLFCHKAIAMIEVFKTNVTDSMDAAKLLQLLNRYFPQSRINFDLHDCDKILRVEGHDFITGQIIGLLQENGFHCSILDH